MGLLTLYEKPLNWDEAKNHSEYIRGHGIRQFINLFKKHKERYDPRFKWGDEVRRYTTYFI